MKLTVALLVLAVGEAVLINYLYRYRVIEIQFPAAQNHRVELPETVIRPLDPDEYVTHAFPDGEVCTFANTICYIRI